MAGRNRDREAYWRGVIEAWQRSGLGAAAYCRRKRIADPSFYIWRKRLGLTRPLPPSRPARTAAFRRVRIVSEGPAPSRAILELSLSDGRVLRLHTEVTAELVAGLVRALEAAPC